ncbi:Cna B-type domain-containing protein, partial [Ligilactobacillus ceti]
MFKKTKTWVMLASMLASFAVTPVSSVIQANQIKEAKVTPQVTQPAPAAQKGMIVETNVRWANAAFNHPYYGGEAATLYNHIKISGAQALLHEGGYIVNRLAKQYFDRPNADDFRVKNDRLIKDVQVIDDPNSPDYKIITTLDKMYGGETADLPIQVRLKSYSMKTNLGTVNQAKRKVKIALYNNKHQLLNSNDAFVLTGKSRMYGFYNERETPNVSKDVVDGFKKDYHLKPGTKYLFGPGGTPSVTGYQGPKNDPRMRRVYAKIPAGMKVAAQSGWKFDNQKKQYYVDIPANKLQSPIPKIPLDFSGIDMAKYTSDKKTLDVRVDFTMYALNPNGQLGLDLKPLTWYNEKHLYISMNTWEFTALITPGISVRGIDSQYKPYPVKDHYYWHPHATQYLIPGEPAEVIKKNDLVKYTIRNISTYKLNNTKSDENYEFVVKNSSIPVPKFRRIKQVRMLLLGNLTPAQQKDLTQRLKGTKVYGVKNGHKELLTDKIKTVYEPSFKKSYNANGYLTVNLKHKQYDKILFEYPNGGLRFKTTKEMDTIAQTINSEMILDPDVPSLKRYGKYVYNSKDLYAQIQGFVDVKNAKTQKHLKDITFNNAKSSRGSDVFGTVNSRILGDATIKTISTNPDKDGRILDKDTYHDLKDIIRVKNNYYYGIGGPNLQISPAVVPENRIVYYLVPNAIYPADKQADVKILDTIYGYKPGKNLVIAKVTKKMRSPWVGTRVYSSVNFNTDFKMTPEIKVGKYKIEAAMALDNNKLGYNKGFIKGIEEPDTLTNLKWNDFPITTKYNHSELPEKYTDLEDTSFQVYPPLYLKAYKTVKLHADSDQHYGLSTGKAATFNDKVDYQLAVRNDKNDPVEHLTAIDILPYKGDWNITPNEKGVYEPRNSKFSTQLLSVEKSNFFNIFYSTDKPVKDLTKNLNATWSSTLPKDLSKVTMIKWVMKPGKKIYKDQVEGIVVHAQMPSDENIPDKATSFNTFAISQDPNLAVDSFIESLAVKTILSYRRTNIKLIKKDRQTKQPLSGAEFSLYSDKEKKVIKEHLKTNDQGEVELPDLVVGYPYTLTETKAPKGYYVNDQKLKFVAKEKQTLEFLDQLDRKIDVSVHKNWIDAPADKPVIKLQLMRDGQAYQKPVTLDHNQLDYKWNVSQYSPAGKLYNYTVQEVGVKNNQVVLAGQTYAVSSTNTSNHTIITNTNVGQTISVVKKWSDDQNRDKQRPDKIHIHLLANGQAVKEADLDENHQWQVDFTQLPVYENGQKIKYTVTEDQVNGYQPTIEQKDNNFIITNKHEVALTT